MLKPYSKFQDSMLKILKFINTFTSQFSQILVQCFSLLVQAVTSQAGYCKHLKGVLIEYMSDKMLESNVFRIQYMLLFQKEHCMCSC